MLSNTHGLGVDRVVRPSSVAFSIKSNSIYQLEFKIVTPDGQYLTANACQNADLFWALRGGMSEVLFECQFRLITSIQVEAEHSVS